MPRILVTTTSFQDTPGSHHDLLAQTGWEIVTARGPLDEAGTLVRVGAIDAWICGDDRITDAVLAQARPRLQVISKYGIGVDKIDVDACTRRGLPVLFTPGVNHTTVAEHVFLLLLCLQKHLLFHADAVRAGQWPRQTGHELWHKTIGIIGLGRIGKEVAVRARAFGMKVIAHDIYWDAPFAAAHQVTQASSRDDVFAHADYLSLHVNLTPETRNLVCAATLARMKEGVQIINCARGEIVHTADLVAALESGHVAGYGADVLDQEPPPADHPLLRLPQVVITPHIGSRTFESVQRQATKAVQNLINVAQGQAPLAQVNPSVPFIRGQFS